MKRLISVLLTAGLLAATASCKLATYRSLETSSREPKQLAVVRDSYLWIHLVILPIIIYTGSDALLCDVDAQGDLECLVTEN